VSVHFTPSKQALPQPRRGAAEAARDVCHEMKLEGARRARSTPTKPSYSPDNEHLHQGKYQQRQYEQRLKLQLVVSFFVSTGST
jgi:hypothetical protein